MRLLEGQPSREKADGLIRTALARAIPVMGYSALDPETALCLFNGIVAFLVSTQCKLNANHYYEVAGPLLVLVTEHDIERYRAWVKEVANVKGSHAVRISLS